MEESATALARMGQFDAALVHLTKGRDRWTPARTDPFGDLDRAAARLELARGRLEAAEQYALASVRRWDGGRLFSRTASGLVLATIQISAGELRALSLAH